MKIHIKNHPIQISVFVTCFLTLFLFSSPIAAKNIGTIGKIYPINEIDFLEFIKSRALSMQQNGMLSTLQKDMQKQAVHYRDRPASVIGLSRTPKSKSWLFDPSIILASDVKTPEGKVIATAGTRVNPLVHISLTRTLIFYDADDKKQMEWVLSMDKKLKGQDKIILVNGSTLQEEKRLSKQIYFDQAGLLITRFHIQHVPATVEQEGNALRIREVKL
jgi:conjugal transfer pilus assembly protein TraW